MRYHANNKDIPPRPDKTRAPRITYVGGDRVKFWPMLAKVLLFTAAAAGLALAAQLLVKPANAATGTDEVFCNYVGPGGGMHPTQVEGATAVLCSDGSSTVLINPDIDHQIEQVAELPVPVATYFELGDVLSTFAGIEYGGLKEANPIMRPFTGDWWGYPIMFGIKAGMTAYARTAPPQKCQTTLQMSNAIKGGAICNNVALTVAALALDTSIPLAGSLGIMALCGVPSYLLTEESSKAECADGVPSLLFTARAQQRLERWFGESR